MNVNDTQHFRKTVAGIAMVGAPLLGLASAVLYPSMSTDELRFLDAVAENETRFTISIWLGAVSIMLGLLAVLGLVHLMRERRPGLAHVGGGLALMGLVGVGMFQGVDLVVAQMVRGDADPVEMASLLQRVTDSAVLPAISAMAAMAGFIVLAVAGWRAHVLPVLPAVFIAGWALSTGIGYSTAENAFVLAGWAMFVLGLGATGVTVLTETDEQWEHAPEVHGMWAMPAHM